jgi:hypothetical protein
MKAMYRALVWVYPQSWRWRLDCDHGLAVWILRFYTSGAFSIDSNAGFGDEFEWTHDTMLQQYQLSWFWIFNVLSSLTEFREWPPKITNNAKSDVRFKQLIYNLWCVHNRLFNAYYFEDKFKWTPDIKEQ